MVTFLTHALRTGIPGFAFSRPVPRFLHIQDLKRHWPTLTGAVLVLVLLAQVARLLWLSFAPAAAPVTTAIQPSQVPDLAGMDPFNGKAAPGEAADTGGGWALFGLRVDGGGGSAILARDKAPQQSYRVGEEISPGVVLESVAVDHVVLMDGGVSRRLELPSTPAASPAPSAAAASTTPANAASAQPPPATPTSQDATRDADPARLLAEAGLRSHREDGRVAGYTLMPKGNDLMLRAAGLRPGDVLLSVNGQALDAEHLPEVAERLKSSRQAVVTYRRDGQTRTVTLGTARP